MGENIRKKELKQIFSRIYSTTINVKATKENMIESLGDTILNIYKDDHKDARKKNQYEDKNQFHVGDQVILRDLKLGRTSRSGAHLNGEEGVVMQYLPKTQRYLVQLNDRLVSIIASTMTHSPGAPDATVTLQRQELNGYSLDFLRKYFLYYTAREVGGQVELCPRENVLESLDAFNRGEDDKERKLINDILSRRRSLPQWQ